MSVEFVSTDGFVSMLSLADLYFFTENSEGGYTYTFQWSTQAVKGVVDGVFNPDINDYYDEDEEEIDEDYYTTKALYDYVSANKNDGTDQADSFVFRIYNKETGTLVKEISTTEKSVDVDELLYGEEYLWEVAALKNGQVIKTSDKLYFCTYHNPCDLPEGAYGQMDSYSYSKIYNASSENHAMKQTGHSGHIEQGVITSYGNTAANFFVCGETVNGNSGGPRGGQEAYEIALKSGYTFSISNNVGGIDDDFPTTENCLFTLCGIYVFNEGKWDYLAYSAKTDNANRCQNGDYFALDDDIVTQEATCVLYQYNSKTGHIDTIATAASDIGLISPKGIYYQTLDGIYQTGTDIKVASAQLDYGGYFLYDDVTVNVYCLYNNTQKTDDLEDGESGSVQISYIPLDGTTAGKTQIFTVYETDSAPAELETDDSGLIIRIDDYICYLLNIEGGDCYQSISVVHKIRDDEITEVFADVFDGGLITNYYLNEDGDLAASFHYRGDGTLEEKILIENSDKSVTVSGDEKGLFWKAAEDSVQELSIRNSENDGSLTYLVEEGVGELKFYGIASGNYECSYRLEDQDAVTVSQFTVKSEDSNPSKFTGTTKGAANLFFARKSGIWSSNYIARHNGFLNGWTGTKETVDLAGKNIIADVLMGGDDENLLVLTDDSNGDALFVEDIYTAFGKDAARLAQIDEIRAGAGDDIIDMTSQLYAYDGGEMTIRAGAGNDVIWASGSDNDLFGDEGNDRIVGSSGFDLIAGGTGNDSMHSGGGNDIFAFCENWGQDTVEITDNAYITLWFASGSEDNWDAAGRVYSNGIDSVTVIGGANSTIELKFGNEGGQYYDLMDVGAFEGSTHKEIFESTEKSILA
ncbi:MAG: hypothetical protein IKA79_01080 [Lentisphaeria bacterium]|nr:hypothetical protein [Lentisphaeria bacterium]